MFYIINLWHDLKKYNLQDTTKSYLISFYYILIVAQEIV